VIDKLMFGTPSGSVLGTLHSQVEFKKGSKTVANHMFLVGDTKETAKVTLKLPATVSLDELRHIAAKLVATADQIEAEMDNPATERINIQYFDSGEIKVIND